MAVTCDNPSISIQELLNSLLVKTNTGVYGLRVKRVSAAAGNIESVIACGTINLTEEQIMRYAIGLSTSGEPALILIEEA
jgi:hypothetical protein